MVLSESNRFPTMKLESSKNPIEYFTSMTEKRLDILAHVEQLIQQQFEEWVLRLK